MKESLIKDYFKHFTVDLFDQIMRTFCFIYVYADNEKVKTFTVKFS